MAKTIDHRAVANDVVKACNKHGLDHEQAVKCLIYTASKLLEQHEECPAYEAAKLLARAAEHYAEIVRAVGEERKRLEN